MWKGASENSLNVCDYANQGRHRKHLHLASGSDMNYPFQKYTDCLAITGWVSYDTWCHMTSHEDHSN